jgi:acetylornithine/succinyldiaminopimelate/putrescine aminotransferase
VLVIVAGDSALRFCPPLVVTEAELDEGVRVLDEVLSTLERAKSPAVVGAQP